MTQHYARFVRSNSIEDVEKRTVAHFHGWEQEPPAVGDYLVGVPEGPLAKVDLDDGEQVEVRTKPWRRGLARRIVNVIEVHLLEVLTEEELTKLDRDIDTYFEVWDMLHPDALAKTNPLVLRLELEPGGHIVDLPTSWEEEVVQRLSQIAYDDITAIEDARVFASLTPVSSQAPVMT